MPAEGRKMSVRTRVFYSNQVFQKASAISDEEDIVPLDSRQSSS